MDNTHTQMGPVCTLRLSLVWCCTMCALIVISHFLHCCKEILKLSFNARFKLMMDINQIFGGDQENIHPTVVSIDNASRH